MTLKLKQFKDYLKTLDLSLSDLFLAVGFLFSVIFYAFAWWFMVTDNPNDVPCPPWLIITCFSGVSICWGIYFYLEIKKGNIRNSLSTWLFILFVVWGFVGVLVQPRDFSIDVVVRAVNEGNAGLNANVGDIVTVTRPISTTHVMFFAMASTVITTIFYIIFINLSKRIKDMNFIIFVGYCIFIFMFILAVYSYITEADHYVPFLKALFSGDIDEAYKHTVYSFVANRVPYGVCMMLGYLFALICHALTKKWYYYLIAAFMYINMIFSYCKTALFMSLLAFIIYLVYQLIATYKDNKKRNNIIIIVASSIVGVLLVLSLISIFTQGAFLPLVYKVFSSFVDQRTIDTRTYIWANTYHLLENGWWLLGRGFGTYNFMLYPMNIVNGDYVCPSHSTFNAILGAGGALAILLYFGLWAYYIYVFIKCFKMDWKRTIELSIGLFAFVLYSFTEGVNYLILVFMFPLFVCYHIKQKEKDATWASKHNWFI